MGRSFDFPFAVLRFLEAELTLFFVSIQSVGILKELDPDIWHVTVVSPENYFLFHPLLRSSIFVFHFFLSSFDLSFSPSPH
jgi:hypothetical protein